MKQPTLDVLIEIVAFKILNKTLKADLVLLIREATSPVLLLTEKRYLD